MKACFADTFFYIALLDEDDEHHARAKAFSVANTDFIVTTRWVLSETADAMCGVRLRQCATQFLERVEHDADTMIVGASDELYHRGRKLYAARPDKEWSLTDCVSFLVMQEQGITEALTGDRHFEQAGFKSVFAA